MYRVSKVLNNNGVIAIDMDENKEYVILGKGVGFGKKVSQRFDKPEGCTTYRLEQETERGSHLATFVSHLETWERFVSRWIFYICC